MKLLLHPAAAPKVNALAASPGGSVLLYGVKGVGKRTIAQEIARQLNCLGCEHNDCRACRMVLGANHPDVITINPDAKGKIGIEQVHQLLHDLQYEQYEPAGKRVVIIAQAHCLTLPAQNSLLKCLEEPPNTTIILTSENLQSLLPTVISRCRSVHVPRVSDDRLAAYLHPIFPAQEKTIQTVVALSQGAVGIALSLLNDAKALEQHQQLKEEVENLFKSSELFDRMQLASKMAAKDNLDAYVSIITATSHNLAREGGGLHVPGAVERLNQRLSANVSPRTALEALAVELS